MNSLFVVIKITPFALIQLNEKQMNFIRFNSI